MDKPVRQEVFDVLAKIEKAAKEIKECKDTLYWIGVRAALTGCGRFSDDADFNAGYACGQSYVEKTMWAYQTQHQVSLTMLNLYSLAQQTFEHETGVSLDE
jgi:hypothetical protein